MSEHGGNFVVNGGFAAIFSGIFVEALEPLVNWLLVMTFIIIADLESGIPVYNALRDLVGLYVQVAS